LLKETVSLNSLSPIILSVVARPDNLKIKPTARRALSRVSALYLSGETGSGVLSDKQLVSEFLAKSNGNVDRNWPILARGELPQLINRLLELNEGEFAGAR